MTHTYVRSAVAALVAAAVAVPVGGCGGAARPAGSPSSTPAASPTAAPPAIGATTGATTGATAVAPVPADSVHRPWTAADARFMSGMIQHHAQAIEMARLAPTHGASPSVQRLAERIINAQEDEIATMRRWLTDRGQPVPAVQPTLAAPGVGGDAHAGHDAHAQHAPGHAAGQGAAHDAHAGMTGMLTPAQMRELDAARGPAFDERFLRFMIQHHKGAVSMVTTLFATDGAGQDETVFKFASDVQVDQRTEIARMERMLFAMLLERESS